MSEHQRPTNQWVRYPVIYEINTWVWLEELSRKHHMRVTLASVPEEEWDTIASFGFDAVWLMGVWRRSPAGIAIANSNEGLLADFRRALPDFTLEDNVGSPYCVRAYAVDERLGGRLGLAVARTELACRSLALILDFVPNHVAFDHAWVTEHPEYFVRGTADDARNAPDAFAEVGSGVFARGRDPYFPPWPDVLQLNAFDPGLREAVIATLGDIASQCDGVRCDMAMLALNDVFERTWGQRAGGRLPTDYWTRVISEVNAKYPTFLFIAEAYWDREWDLQQRGFAFCYDKRLYDRLVHDTAGGVRGHLRADLRYQARLVRFIENHDEPRAAATFAPARHRAAAVTMATIPGAKLLHEGQFEGRRVRPPVFLRRRPAEEPDADLQAFYHSVVKLASSHELRDGEWQLCHCDGWPDNQSCRNLGAWCWHSPAARVLVVVNLSDTPAQGRVRLPWGELAGLTCTLTDLVSTETFERNGDDILKDGLYIGLGPWQFHVLGGWPPPD